MNKEDLEQNEYDDKLLKTIKIIEGIIMDHYEYPEYASVDTLRGISAVIDYYFESGRTDEYE